MWRDEIGVLVLNVIVLILLQVIYFSNIILYFIVVIGILLA